MKSIVYIIASLFLSSCLIVWPFLGEVNHHGLCPLSLMPESVFICNRTLQVSKGEFIFTDSRCFLPTSPCSAEGSLLWSSQQPPLHSFPPVLQRHQREARFPCHMGHMLWVYCHRYVLCCQESLGRVVASSLFVDAGRWSNIEWIYFLPHTLLGKNVELTKDMLFPVNSCIARVRGSLFESGF